MSNGNNEVEVEIDWGSLPTAIIALLGCARPTAYPQSRIGFTYSRTSYSYLNSYLQWSFRRLFPEKDRVRISLPVLSHLRILPQMKGATMTIYNRMRLGIISNWNGKQSDWVRLGRRLRIPSQTRHTIFSSVCLSSYDIMSRSVKHAIICLQTAEHHRCCLLQRCLWPSALLRFIHQPVRFGSTLHLSLPDRPNYGPPSQA